MRRGLSSALGLSAAFVCVGHLLISWLLSAGAAPPSPVRLGLIAKSDDTAEPLEERLHPLKRHRCMTGMFYTDSLREVWASWHKMSAGASAWKTVIYLMIHWITGWTPFVFKGVLRTNSKVTSTKEKPPPWTTPATSICKAALSPGHVGSRFISGSFFGLRCNRSSSLKKEPAIWPHRLSFSIRPCLRPPLL